MSAVKVIRNLLANHSSLTAVVPATRIMAGVLPQSTALPAIGITHISTTRRHTVAGGSNEYCSSRVQVTVMAANYPSKQSILELIRASLPRSRGLVNGVNVDSIILEMEGPDFSDSEVKIFMQSNDFIVNFTE